MSPALTARCAEPHEAEAVVNACLAAFHDEAVLSWVLPDPAARRAAAREMFDASLLDAIAAEEVLVALDGAGSVVGVSVWADSTVPGAGDADDADGAASSAGDSVPDDPVPHRLALVAAATAEARPTVPHLLLDSMAALPAHRGRGIGSALLRHGLARADRRGLPVYLEASTPRNQALYERFGFRTAGPPIALPDGGPTLRPMWRAERTTA